MKKAKQRKGRSSENTEAAAKNLSLITATREGNVDKVQKLLKDKKINVDVREDLHLKKVVAHFHHELFITGFGGGGWNRRKLKVARIPSCVVYFA